MTPTGPRVSVIVPAYNGAERLTQCLEAIALQDYPPTLVDVLVIDNASEEDLTATLPGDARFSVLKEPRRGSYAARNRGLEEARGEVLAFTDADCVPEPSWLSALVNGLASADMVGGRIVLTFAGGNPVSGPELYEAVHGFPQERYLADQHFAATANMATWRTVMDRVGDFNASLQSRGDAEWGQRAAAAGCSQRFVPLAVVRHPARATMADLIMKIRRVATGRTTAELSDGRSARHFVGVAASQIRSVVAGGRASKDHPAINTGSARLRYVAVLFVCRAITAGYFLRAAWTALLRRQ